MLSEASEQMKSYLVIQRRGGRFQAPEMHDQVSCCQDWRFKECLSACYDYRDNIYKTRRVFSYPGVVSVLAHIIFCFYYFA